MRSRLWPALLPPAPLCLSLARWHGPDRQTVLPPPGRRLPFSSSRRRVRKSTFTRTKRPAGRWACEELFFQRLGHTLVSRKKHAGNVHKLHEEQEGPRPHGRGLSDGLLHGLHVHHSRRQYVTPAAGEIVSTRFYFFSARFCFFALYKKELTP